jgi:glycosyltransferase involved in cell wall biosynthesis
MNSNKPLKVVMLNSSDSTGGAAIACNRLINALKCEHGSVEVTLLVLNKSSNDNWVTQIGNRINFILEKLFFLFLEKSKKERFAFSTARFGVDVSTHPLILEADIIHLHWINQGFLSLEGIQSLLQLNKKLFWTFHDMWPMTGGCHHSYQCNNYKEACGNCVSYLRNPKPNDLSNEIFNKKSTWLNRDKIKLVSPSIWMDKRISSSALFRENKRFQIPNTLDSQIFKPQEKTRTTDSIKILFAAVSIENYFKGFSLFLETLNSLNHPEKEIIIIIAGKVSEENLKSLSFKYELLGIINSEHKMASVYNSVDLFVSTSMSESFSYTCLEAVFCGTPVIAYNTGEIPNFIKHKGNGYLVEEYSKKGFLEGFDWFFKNKIKQRSEAVDLSQYDFKTVSQEMLKAYRSAS